jgi:hypothetical protein
MYGKRVKKFNSSSAISKLWEDYMTEYTFASGITYKAVMESVEELAKMLLHQLLHSVGVE